MANDGRIIGNTRRPDRVGSFRIEGLDPLMANLRGLPITMQNRIVRPAVASASRVILKSAKAHVPVRHGTLRKSLGFKVKTYRASNQVIGLVGPRKETSLTEVLPKGKAIRHRPVRYAHLVEFGTAAHIVAARGHGKALRIRGAGGKFAFRRRVVIPAVHAKPFLRPAVAATRGQVAAVMRAKIFEGVERHAPAAARHAFSLLKVADIEGTS